MRAYYLRTKACSTDMSTFSDYKETTSHTYGTKRQWKKKYADESQDLDIFT